MPSSVDVATGGNEIIATCQSEGLVDGKLRLRCETVSLDISILTGINAANGNGFLDVIISDIEFLNLGP